MGDAPEVGEAPTERELELFRLYETHGSMMAVAEAAHAGEGYVRNKLSFLYKKLGVKSAIQAGRALREKGLI